VSGVATDIDLEHLAWSAGDVRVAFTTRSGGVSGDPYSSLNLGTATGDRIEDVLANRLRVQSLTGQARVAMATQVHGTDAIEAVGNWNDPLSVAVEADALILRRGAGTAAAVLVADCAPVIVVGNDAVAVIHAGWRGTVNGIVEQAVTALGAWTHAVIGPCIGPCCLEMGSDVASLFESANHRPHIDADKVYVDARAEIVSRLAATGEGSIDLMDVCTKCDDRFFSFRGTGGTTGRQCGIAWFTADADEV
jgi:YfiH family protein